MFLKILQCSQENTCVGDFFNSLLFNCLQLYEKETPTQVFPCESYKIFRTPPVAAGIIIIHRFECVIAVQKIIKKRPFMRNVPVHTITLKDLNFKDYYSPIYFLL